jgi:hypothetical protein
MKWRSLVLASLAAGALALPAPASAVNITGTFSISGGFTYDTMGGPCGAGGCTLAGLDFTQALPPPGSPTGPFTQVTAATQYFAGLGMTAFVTMGQIKNITNNPVPPANYTFAPDGVTGPPFPIANFLGTFINCGSCGGLHFDLTSFPDQVGNTCPPSGGGTSCVEGPFIITQTLTGLRIDFDVFGRFINGADSGIYKGSFGVTMDGLSFATLGARIGPGGTGQFLACGVNNLETPCSFTANFNPFVVPEPATLLTFGLGSLALTRLRNRRKKN